MKRVKENGEWCLMCPHESPGLSDCYGDEFEELYMKYEAEGRFKETKINAQDTLVCYPYISDGNRNTVSPIRMPVIESLIRITLEQLSLLISVMRSLNIQMMKRQLFVI